MTEAEKGHQRIEEERVEGGRRGGGGEASAGKAKIRNGKDAVDSGPTAPCFQAGTVLEMSKLHSRLCAGGDGLAGVNAGSVVLVDVQHLGELLPVLQAISLQGA